jgi:hypothetical protein
MLRAMGLLGCQVRTSAGDHDRGAADERISVLAGALEQVQPFRPCDSHVTLSPVMLPCQPEVELFTQLMAIFGGSGPGWRASGVG